MIAAFIPKLFTVFCARNMRETPEIAIVVMMAHHLPDSYHIILALMGILEMAEKGKLNTFFWLFTWLDQRRMQA